jgi:hypothetical protein
MELNILGAKYEYKTSTAKEDPALRDGDGYCDQCAKIICVESDHDENDPLATKNMPEYDMSVKRHEIIHAFLYESGLPELARNEQIVDWIAWQFPKMLEVFKEVDAI